MPEFLPQFATKATTSVTPGNNRRCVKYRLNTVMTMWFVDLALSSGSWTSLYHDRYVMLSKCQLYPYFLGFVVSSTTMISHIARRPLLSCLFMPSFLHNLRLQRHLPSLSSPCWIVSTHPLEIISALHRPEKCLVYRPSRIREIIGDLSTQGSKKTL